MMEETRMFISIFLTLFSLVVCNPDPGELRVPRVYNALITSGANLTPSRALPVFQPILHETAYGYPLQQTLIYHDALKANPQYAGDQSNSFVVNRNDESKNPLVEKFEQLGRDTLDSKPKTDGSNQQTNKNQKPGDPSSPDNPLKLNEFGLPPSLIPIQPYEQRNPYPYDPYNSYNPYNTFYPSPYYNSPYNPYLYQNPYYNIPPLQPHSGLPRPLGPSGALPPNGFNPNSFPPNSLPPTGLPPSGLLPTGLPPTGLPPNNLTPNGLPPTGLSPTGLYTPLGLPIPTSPPELQSSEQAGSPGLAEQQPDKSISNIPKSPPPDLNIKNNGNKNPDIPDVPPPPLPRGGLKYDNDKSQKS